MKRSSKIYRPKWNMLIDTREQTPWTFESITIGVGCGKKDLQLSINTKKLDCGDYSIEGMEDRVAIERKSMADLYGTLSRGRSRFIRELAKLNQLEFAAVIVEAEWSEAMMSPPERSRLLPVCVDGMINAWMIRFPRVHWVWCPGRYIASKRCFKLLDRFYGDKNGDAETESLGQVQRADEEAC